MSASHSAVPDPTQIGRYEIAAKLGAGAFGTVYKAKDPELDRFVAIKTIRLEGLAASQASLDDLVARFKREAKVAAKLEHPNIVGIFDIGSMPGNSYLVMEFIDGVGLDHVIKGSGKMAVERAAAIGLQVAQALDYAWSKEKLVHRDIKPANIMIEPGDHVKVTDFGIAKLMTGDTVDHLTATGSLLGTPSYMSPEQARGLELDGRSDLFSLGCILYEMVAGQRAFRGDSITALLFKIVTEEPPSLKELDPTVSDEMLRIIGKALSKAPETRYQTGHELAEDLTAVTRPGYVPTLRSRETPTLAPDAPPGDVPTISSPATARSPQTISSAPTTAAGPAIAPTVLSPQTGRTGPPPIPPQAAAAPPLPSRAAAPPPRVPPRASTAAAQPAARRSGGGAGLVIGLGITALVLLALVAAGGWYFLGRTPANVAENTPPTTAPAELPPPSSSVPAEATPLPEPPAPSTPAASGTQPASTRTSPATPTPIRPGASLPPRPPATQPPAAVDNGPAPGDFSHLDQLPPEGPDGRELGDAAARSYSQGGTSNFGTQRRFARRQRWPRGVTVAERPAVGTLLYLSSVEEAYHKKNGRYATLRELMDARMLRLDTALEGEGFTRARYGFRLALTPDGYRADAAPAAPVGRPFFVDDSGIVQLEE